MTTHHADLLTTTRAIHRDGSGIDLSPEAIQAAEDAGFIREEPFDGERWYDVTVAGLIAIGAFGDHGRGTGLCSAALGMWADGACTDLRSVSAGIAYGLPFDCGTEVACARWAVAS